MRYIDRLFRAPEGVRIDTPLTDAERQPPSAPMLTAEQRERVLDAYRPPAPVPATEQLRRNLDRASAAYTDRERVLVEEIAARETELADVRRAKDAVEVAIMELSVGDELAAMDVDALQDAVEAARHD